MRSFVVVALVYNINIYVLYRSRFKKQIVVVLVCVMVRAQCLYGGTNLHGSYIEVCIHLVVFHICEK